MEVRSAYNPADKAGTGFFLSLSLGGALSLIKAEKYGVKHKWLILFPITCFRQLQLLSDQKTMPVSCKYRALL
jgi:hypothetical protein